MYEETEDSVAEYSEVWEIDPDYEFDASRFFDFTRPELNFEVREAERWFQTAGTYPPSPFVIKLNCKEDIYVEDANASLCLGDERNTKSMKNNSNADIESVPEACRLEKHTEGQKYCDIMALDTLEKKTKPMARSFKPRSSTLMKPTASHLAKQSKARVEYSSQLCGRSGRSSQNSSTFESLATKRQKIESGYVRKVANLKHKTLLSHKMAKTVGVVDANSLHHRCKITIPKEPDLETAQRAQRRSFRSKNFLESSEDTKTKAHTFKAHPLNRKILKAPSLPLHKKSTPQMPEFQVFHLKTMKRATQHSSAKISNACPSSVELTGAVAMKRLENEEALNRAQCETLQTSEICNLNEKISLNERDTTVFQKIKSEGAVPMKFNFLSDKRFSQHPPIEMFSKLSLKSEVQTETVSQPKSIKSVKGSKENAPNSVQLEFWRCVGKPKQYGTDRMIAEIGAQPQINW